MARKLLLLDGSDGLERRGDDEVEMIEWSWLEMGMVEAMETIHLE